MNNDDKQEPPPKTIVEAALRVLWTSRLRRTIIIVPACTICLLAIYSSLPKEAQQIIFARFFNVTSEDIPDIEVQNFVTIDDDADAVWLSTKIERNLTELFSLSDHKVRHDLAAKEWSTSARKIVEGRIDKRGDTFLITAKFVEDGITKKTLGFEGSFVELEEVYKSLPEAILFGLGVNLHSLKLVRRRQEPTKNIVAYAFYLEARRVTSFEDFEKAERYLHTALSHDPNFAMSYWALGQLASRRGDIASQEYFELKALSLDKDHPRLPIYSNPGDPFPSLIDELQKVSWKDLSEGLRYKHVNVADHDLNFHAWSFEQTKFSFGLAHQLASTGSTVEELLADSGAIFALNGGFFDIDVDHRLSPSGLLKVDGYEVGEYKKNAGSGAIVIIDGKAQLGWSKAFESTSDRWSVLQSGPMVVDPGGTNGIYRNDLNRLDRAAICTDHASNVIFFLVKGGLSLYELGRTLSLPTSKGGFGCDKAINLDGGPSAQAALNIDGRNESFDGLWKVNSAVLVERLD